MNHQQQQQQFIQQHQQQVLNLLGWNDETYNQYRYEKGNEYLAVYFGKDQQAIDKLSQRKEFWNWWNSMWNARDLVFDEFVTEHMKPAVILGLYHQLHDVHQLVTEIGPPSVVLGAAFEKIIIMHL